MLRSKTLRRFSIPMMLTALALGATSPAHAVDHTDPPATNTCVSDTGDLATPGDDVCTLSAYNYYEFADQIYAPDTYLLGNDNEDASAGVCDIGPLSDAIGGLSLFKDSTGYLSMSLWINSDWTDDFSFTYTDCNFASHTVMVHVIPYVPPASPTVKKAAQKGYLKAKEPSVANNGVKIVLLYGTFRNPSPDCYTVVKPAIWKKFRVHRKNVDWIAYTYATGEYVDEGKVKNVRLPKGDHPPKQPCQKITGKAAARSLLGKTSVQEFAGKWQTHTARVRSGAVIGFQRHGGELVH